MSCAEWNPDTYLAQMNAEIPGYEELEEAVAAATAGLSLQTVLELGTGTGETALRVLARHPGARWTGIDASEPMLDRARERLPNADLRKHEPHNEHRVAVLAIHCEELLHDVEERAGRNGEEDDGHRFARPRLAEHGAEEGRRAADRAQQRQEAPARPRALAAHRAADAEALGRVVEAEADDQRHREADLICRGSLPDREALPEVVHADADRNQERELHARRQRLGRPALPELVGRRGARADEGRRPPLRALLHPLRVVDEAHQAEDEAAETERGVPCERAPVPLLQRMLDRGDGAGEDVPEQEEQDPRRERAEPGT